MKFSGKFQLRIDSDVHKARATKAMQADESLNSFCSKALKKIISQPDVVRADNPLERDR